MTLRKFLKQILKTPLPENLSAESLALYLYQNHFTRRAVAKKKMPPPAASAQKAFIRAVVNANVFPYIWTPLELKHKTSGGGIFSLNGLNIIVTKSQCRSKSRRYEVKLPSHCLEQDIWYRFFSGDFQKVFSAPLARIYFNCTPKGAVQLLKEWSKTAATSQMSFALKLGINLKNYLLRNDNCILYYRRSDEEIFSKHIAKRGQFLRPENLPLTRILAPGVSYAEDPVNESTSFGMHRCLLIAKGLSQSNAKSKFEGHHANVVRIWKQEGLVPDEPWLSPKIFYSLADARKKRAAR